MNNAKVFDPVPAQKRARAAEGPAAAPLLAVRPFAEAKAKVENGEQRDLFGEYVQRRAAAAATEGGGALGSGKVVQRTVISIGTESTEKGTLTYSESGSIQMEDGTTLKGIILVLIQIPGDQRKKGYGAKLMAYFMKEVVKGKPCYLDVKAVGEEGLSNDQLETWYQKFGFATLGKSDTGPVMGANLSSWEERGMGVSSKMKDYLSEIVK